jgi:membrane AbrB-like protein
MSQLSKQPDSPTAEAGVSSDASPHRPDGKRGPKPPVASGVRLGAAVLATFATGLAGGFVAKALNLPMPWMTGALLVTAALGLANVPVRSLWQARTAGQFVTGTAVGTQFTQAILFKLLALLPVILAASIVSIVVGAIASLILIRITGLDRKTAFFCTMPAGVIEMANIAVRQGGDPLPIMVLQTMRVGLTVCAAPFFVTYFSEGARQAVTAAATMPWPTVALAIVGATVCGGMCALLRVPNGWFLGALVSSGTLGALGLVEGRVPDVLLVVAQTIIGTSIGTQFRHEFLTRLFRLLVAALVTVPFAVATMALIGALCAYLLAVPVPTMVLATAPAGIAEMALTGKVLGLDAPLITGFQLCRILVVTLGVVPAWHLFERLTAKRT